MTARTQFPIPPHFDPTRAGEIWRIPYQALAEQAKSWAKRHSIQPAGQDHSQICLLAIDLQNTFCIPEFELFVGGRSGMGAVEDNVRLCEFIYRNLGVITEIIPTMDTHTAMQIFHAAFWVDDVGENPAPMTMISVEDIVQGKWRVNPAITYSLARRDFTELQNFALHYAKRLSDGGKYPLTIWPYHAMLGGIGHALAAIVEETCFFHNLARSSQTHFEIKGGNPLTENYSVLSPEVLDNPAGGPIAAKNTRLIDKLISFDVVIIAGQAKSHCVAWTIDDLLTEIQAKNPTLTQRVYLLEDCTSPVVVPEVVDFTEQSNNAFQRFADAGMHVVQSTTAITDWPGIIL
ncbi:MAG: isochorismatase [Leptolyngbyaceae cyanobacterium MO_188.B28]|nr:isochorismatase [Leptolyngbyaceae cyanobacterium MO_188.B28]